MRLGHLAHPAWVILPALAALTGCWTRAENQMMEREETMGGHLVALFDATEAVAARDDARYRKAMKDLEKGGELPGVATAGMLEALHTQAAELKKVDDVGARAQGISTLAAMCAGCHAANQVGTPALFEATTPAENALAGVVWQDEERWKAGYAALGGEDAPETWEARRSALARRLTGP